MPTHSLSPRMKVGEIALSLKGILKLLTSCKTGAKRDNLVNSYRVSEEIWQVTLLGLNFKAKGRIV